MPKRRRRQTSVSLIISFGLHGLLLVILSIYVYTHRAQIIESFVASEVVEVKQTPPKPRYRTRHTPPPQVAHQLRSMRMKVDNARSWKSTQTLVDPNRAVSVVVQSNDQPSDLIQAMTHTVVSNSPLMEVISQKIVRPPVDMGTNAPPIGEFRATEAKLELTLLAQDMPANSLEAPRAMPTNFGFSDFLTQVRDRVQKAQSYPRFAREKGLEGIATVRFTLRRDGSVANVELVKSSGLKVLDNAALAAVRIAAPYPPYPDEEEETLQLELPIEFELITG